MRLSSRSCTRLISTTRSPFPEQWRDYFDKMQLLPAAAGANGGRDVAHAPIVESFAQRAREGARQPAPAAVELDRKQVSVIQLVAEYRFRGCLLADLDPLKRQQRPHIPELEPGYYDLTEADMDTVFNTGSLIGPEQATLREIIRALQETYCGTLGVEYMYISSRAEKRWIQERLEPVRSKPSFSPDYKKHILERLTAAEGLEKYLHTRYVGQKRFSLEGGDTLIPMLDNLLQRAGEAGVQELVIGMAHRGRLNVLVNTLGKMPKDLFSEFEGKHDDALLAGDVKYHQGFSSDIMTPGGPMHLTLAFNPSHLEIVNPVVEGSVRARQHRRKDRAGDQVLPVLIHGDAAFAGQGVVMETLNLSQTRGYGTGGTVHIVVNNQIGFTTSDPRDSRSTLYCTDVAKMVEAPIFHVNGDDPEACVMAIEIALDYRTKFKKDVVVDLVCFRKLGHNEQDEPMVTQPLMYKIINQHPGTRKLYADKLVAQGVIGAEDADRLVTTFRAALDGGFHTNKTILSNYKPPFAVDWSKYKNTKWNENDDTTLPLADLQMLAEKLTTLPPDFKLQPRVEKIIADRRLMGQGKLPVDWGMAENLAYASLLKDGFSVRISGQDAGRGTFFHRHAVLHDQNREKWDSGSYIPLQHIAPNQGDFVVIDSVLSEEAVLGFEYGYSTSEPNELVVWEAQFGDFVNGAQVVIDQFIAAGEVKWGRVCGMVMLLPHGYEGQGPEHSSGAPGALPAAVRRLQHPGLRACDAGADVLPAAAADDPPVPQAAHHLHAEEPAAPQGVGVAAGGIRREQVQGGQRRMGRRHRAEAGEARDFLLRQGLLRSSRGAQGERHQGRGHRAHRAALSVPARRVPGADQPLRQCAGSRLVPGRAGQPGRLAPHPALPAAPHARGPGAGTRDAAVVGVAGLVSISRNGNRRRKRVRNAAFGELTDNLVRPVQGTGRTARRRKA